ncbi:MAG: phosphotransferase, partial [Erysipelotrichaceae bacterium]|nr:phosphotransferase [Erysipelotrichaceae bacterium]
EDDQVIKLFSLDHDKADIFNEALNQARVEQTKLKIPHIREVKMFDGQWGIVLDHIKGKTLAQLMIDDAENYDEYLERFVDIQLEIHKQKCPLLNKMKDKFYRKLLEADLDATTRYDLLTSLQSKPNHNKLCHGDFDPSNIIITDENEYYIIDWSHATQGNASADAAKTYLSFMLRGDNARAQQYLELFCTKSEISFKYVQGWIPIVAAEQSVRKRSEERDFLLHLLGVVDYQ